MILALKQIEGETSRFVATLLPHRPLRPDFGTLAGWPGCRAIFGSGPSRHSLMLNAAMSVATIAKVQESVVMGNASDDDYRGIPFALAP
jgi:hypothetical protein